MIFRRRGGDDLEQSFAKWAETVNLAPDVIEMTFEPIVSLLKGVPGLKHLAHAIELYMECKVLLTHHVYADFPFITPFCFSFKFIGLIEITFCYAETVNVKCSMSH